ncbi:hypothetical protein [Roseovarius sp.]|uniref:hypothetical protein n=1 Tax=Roseovarius sp. TaxID=1486281 RepID=UPI00356519A1
MFSKYLYRMEAAFKWPYLALGMAKWMKWASAETASTLTVIDPSGLETAYQVSFTAYAVLHIVLVLSAKAQSDRRH